MTSNFTAAELRKLATNQGDFLEIAAALREYADLKEAAEKGITDKVVEKACLAYRHGWLDPLATRADCMRATLAVVAPLLALTNKETP